MGRKVLTPLHCVILFRSLGLPFPFCEVDTIIVGLLHSRDILRLKSEDAEGNSLHENVNNVLFMNKMEQTQENSDPTLLSCP